MDYFRGYPACSCLIAWLPEYEKELLRRGILKPGQKIRIYQLIGGAPQSGGTHSKGGAADLLDLPGAEDWWLARQMGADASWSRLYNWDNRKGMAHFHMVLRGCPHNGPARYQYTSTTQGVDHGKNGLANHGPDNGPKPLSKRTWEQGIAWAKSQQEDEMPEPQDLWNWDGIPIEEPVTSAANIAANPNWSPKSVLAVKLREQAKQTQAMAELAVVVKGIKDSLPPKA